MPRLAPITSKSALPADHQDIADAVVQLFGHIRGPFSMLLHSPQLAERLLPIVAFVREESIVEPRLRFAAILTAACESNADYVWAAQVEQARKNGIPADFIERIRIKGDPAGLAEDERNVVLYVRQLVREKRVDAATFDALQKKFSAQWLVELTAIVSFFGFVSGICNAFEVEPPVGGDKLHR